MTGEYCEEGKLRFMMKRKNSRIPDACYDRVKGFLYLGGEFVPDSHKRHLEGNAGSFWAQLCNGTDDHATCDSSPGAGDGLCDACTVNGGVTTEDEMFLILGAYYMETPDQ